MYPQIVKIFGIPINSYGFSIMIGFLLASWIAVRRAKPLGIKSDFILDVGIIGMIAGIIGAKINYILQYPQSFPPENPTPWGDTGVHPAGALLGLVPYGFWWWRVRKEDGPVRLYSWQNAVLLVLTLVLAVIGARAVHLVQYWDDYGWFFKGWQSGFVLYGGLIAGVAASALYVKMRGHKISTIADIGAAPIMLAQAFGRIGCFLNGCCYGKVCEGFPGVTFAAGRGAGSPVHPTQLYETAVCIGFFFLLSWYDRKVKKAAGETFLAMMMCYGTWRFLVEFVRGDDRPQWFGLFYSQWVSVGAFVAAAVWLVLLRRRGRPPESKDEGEPSAAPAGP